MENNSANDIRQAKPTAPRALHARISSALRVEVQGFSLALFIAGIVVALLPDGTFARVRTIIYRLAGIRIGARSLILGRLTFTRSTRVNGKLSIGSNTIINAHCFIDLNADVHIGDWVSLGHHVTFITADHAIGPAQRRAGELTPAPIVIESGCWIGARTTILPGVKVGHSTIVAAGSLVSGSIPANRLVGGVPARALKVLPETP